MSKISKITAILILGVMLILLITSSWNDSATMDESIQITAGYSCLTQKDCRLNPQNPLLVKDYAAFPLLFLNLNFPTNIKTLQKDINGQRDAGKIFLYQSGNNPDTILHFARLPIILLAIFFGWLFFLWTKKLYGDKVALLALFFFAFSPTFLAHSRYATTDLAAAFGFFIGITAFLNYLKSHRQNNQFLLEKNQKNSKIKILISTGLIFGVSQLLSFSLLLLFPLYLLLAFIWVFLENYENFKPKKFVQKLTTIIGEVILIWLIGCLFIWAVYLLHTSYYPLQRQIQNTQFFLSSFNTKPLAHLVFWLGHHPILRALGEYLLGGLIAIQRANVGNTTYFLGQVSTKGWIYYYPLLYLLKEHLAFHFLTLLALLFGIRNIIRSREKNLKNFLGWSKDNFTLTASFVFIGVYWTGAIFGPFNIGIRYILPTFPFIYLLVSRQIIRWIKEYSIESPKSIRDWIKRIYEIYIRPTKRSLLVSLCLFWILIATLINFPYYLSYYNELIGGTLNGYKIAVDSNYDWGQDLKRLKNFIEKHNINRIAVDYFGGGDPQYYLGEKFEPWWSNKGKPKNEWFAVSLTSLKTAQAKSLKCLARKPEDSYQWLKDEKPVSRAGTSIFIYKF